jgi:TPR repeat protein
MIGRLYFDGKGVIRDLTEAATWFRKATGEGLPVAQWDLGMMYYRGYGVSKDLVAARAWLQKAAARGYSPANEMLARLDTAVNAPVSARPARLQ